jgi:16S rRNA processing protein RimM
VTLDAVGTIRTLALVEIARIVKPHGLSGEVGVLPYSPDSRTLAEVKEVTLTLVDEAIRIARILAVRPMGAGFLIRFEGVTNRDQAEILREARVSVERAALPQLAVGEAYAVDLVGARVLGPDGAQLGIVNSVIEYPSVDALVIDCSDGRRAELPLIDDWVLRIDSQEGVVVVRSVEGLVT